MRRARTSGELDCSDAVVRMAAASALERVFARVPSDAEVAPEPESAVEPQAAPPAAPPAEALAEDAPPAEEPPPEPKKKKKG